MAVVSRWYTNSSTNLHVHCTTNNLECRIRFRDCCVDSGRIASHEDIVRILDDGHCYGSVDLECDSTSWDGAMECWSTLCSSISPEHQPCLYLRDVIGQNLTTAVLDMYIRVRDAHASSCTSGDYKFLPKIDGERCLVVHAYGTALTFAMYKHRLMYADSRSWPRGGSGIRVGYILDCELLIVDDKPVYYLLDMINDRQGKLLQHIRQDIR